jgi:hypothetical protein
VSKNRDDAIQSIRAVAEKTVRKLEPETGSRMLAYEKVAAVIGVSASWLQKFIKTEGTPEPRWSVGCALVSYYDGLCARVDNQVIAQRAEIRKIIGEINEADPLADRVPLSVSLAERVGLGSDL